MIIAAIVVPIIALAVVWLVGQSTWRDETPAETSSDTELAHTPAAAVTEKYVDSSCTKTGSYDEVVYCSVCREEISRTQKTVNKKPHDYNQKVATAEYLKANATCTDRAVYYYSCSCGAIGDTTFTEGEANGHSFASTWDKNATHHWHNATCEHTAELSGKTEHNYGTDNICDTCGYSRIVNVSGITLNVSFLNLTISDVKTLTATITPKDATNQNVTWSTSNATVVVVDTNGNITAVGVGTAVITATTADGNKTAQCTVAVSAVSPDPGGSGGSGGAASGCLHTATQTKRENEIDSTCKKTGSYDEVIYCSVCGKELSRIQKTIDQKTTHTSGGAVKENIVDSTCKETGSYDEVVYCSVCKKELSRTKKVIAKKETHTEGATIQENFVDSTCSKEGSYDTVTFCSVCGGEFSRIKNTVAKKPHTSGSWVVDKPATCMTAGTRHSSCSVCNEDIRETYNDPDAHTASVEWSFDDTHHWHTCSNRGCNAVLEKSTHNIKDGVCTDCGVKAADSEGYTRDGDYIYFGEYPQSLKTDDVTITSGMDDRGYYLGSDGCCYARVWGNPFIALSGFGYSGPLKFQSGEEIKKNTVYYFKVEPIRWRILYEDGDTALLLCDSIIANRAYNDTRTSSYEQSTIRAWLNDQFYNTAFSVLQRTLINTVFIDNSPGDDTNDKVFLLKRKDVTNPAYGFSPDDAADDPARLMLVSDYAKASGTQMCCADHGLWMLGEAHFGSFADSMNVSLVGDYGRAIYESLMVGDCFGVVPALQIRLKAGSSDGATGLAYRVNDDGTTCTIINVGTCTETDVIIPREINGMKVTSIGEDAFWGSALTSVTLPDSVTSIGKAAFGHCDALTSIILPASVTNIGDHAFEYCTYLTNIIVEENSTLTSIGSYAFNHCPRLESINIPASVTSIGEFAFHHYYTNGCNVYITDLAAWCEISFGNYSANPLHRGRLYLNGQLVKDLVIPDGVTSIKDYAFYDNSYFKSITISDSVTTIGKRAFSSCYNVTSVALSENSQLTTIGENAFRFCDKLTSITIPKNVTHIGDEAFYNCSDLAGINYCGSEEQWQAIDKGTDWDTNTGTYFITYNYEG